MKSTEGTYTSLEQMTAGIRALKAYVKENESLKRSCAQKRDLLEANQSNPIDSYPIYVDIVFKLMPSNKHSFVHTIALPHHWRRHISSDNSEIVLFVKHLKPANDIERIQFERDRDLDLRNTYDHYTQLFEEKLDASTRSRITKIITSKEFKTEYKTNQALDRLSKTYDTYVADAPLMMDKLNPLPRRLGRRFWARERKVPLMINLKAKNLQKEFDRVFFKRENFYVTGRSATESIQVGLMSQPNDEVAANMLCFLTKIHSIYGDLVRSVNLRSRHGNYIPVFLDLAPKSLVTSKFVSSDSLAKHAQVRERLRVVPVH